MYHAARGLYEFYKSQKVKSACYDDYCEHIHLPKNLYDLELAVIDGKLQMKFSKNYYRISKYISRFGRNIIITSKHDWSTEEIVMASLDRYQVEDVFRQSKSGEFGNLRPIWHWTDSKIRCHILCCIIALAYLRLIRLWLKRSGLQMSIDTAMGHMRRLRSCLCWHAGKKEPVRMIEDPAPEQEQGPGGIRLQNRTWGLTKIGGVDGCYYCLYSENRQKKVKVLLNFMSFMLFMVKNS